MEACLTLQLVSDGDLLTSALECEAEVFLRWYGNTEEQLAEEYGPYSDRSVFVAVADERGTVQATARLLTPAGAERGSATGPAGPPALKTLVDVGRPPWSVDPVRAAAAAGLDPATTWEIATISVRQPTGPSGLRLSLALYHGLIAVSRANGMSAFVAVLDERVRRLLGTVGLATRTLPGTRPAPYLGSARSTPVYAHCAAVLDHQRRRFPDAYRLVTLGVGLDGVVVPALEEFTLGGSPERLPLVGTDVLREGVLDDRDRADAQRSLVGAGA